MSKIWFGSDFHLGHKNIQKFRPQPHFGGETMEEQNDFLLNFWRQNVSKRDVVYILGDFCFTEEALDKCYDLPGKAVFLIRGNHDYLDHIKYSRVFDDVYGIVKYKEFWLSHAPIHPQELRGKINLHGHVHNETVADYRYFNCCVENLMLCFNQPMITLDQVRFLRTQPRQKEST